MVIRRVASMKTIGLFLVHINVVLGMKDIYWMKFWHMECVNDLCSNSPLHFLMVMMK